MVPFSTPNSNTPNGGGPKRNRNNDRVFARKAVKNVHDRIDALESRVELEKARHDHTESFLSRKYHGEYEPYSVRRAREELANAASQASLAHQPAYSFPPGASVAGGDQLQSQSSTSLNTVYQGPDYGALARELKELKDIVKLQQSSEANSKETPSKTD